ncbi:hypothetical protein DFH29DRAFT_999848 [Suillus ampliporus]|nr:hypothetical protein DFH29DRAFT_999848 [Suillus ampliporus]
MASPHVAHDHHMDEPAAVLHSFLFDNLGLMPHCGDFVGVDDVDFISYLALGPGPTLFPLYCRPMLYDALTVHISLYAYVLTSIIHRPALETEQSTEVPVFPAKSTRVGPDNRFYVVYDCVGSNSSTTVVHLARHPTGYYPWSSIDLTALAAISDAYDSGGLVIIPDSCAVVMSDNVTEADSLNDVFMMDKFYGGKHLIPGDATSAHTSQAATSNLPTIYSWVSYSGNVMTSTAASIPQSRADHRSTRTSAVQKAKAIAKVEGGLKRVMKSFPKWRLAFAYLRVLLRVVVCIGETENPYLLTFESREEAMHNVWPQALLWANINSYDLEEVLSLTTNTPMSHNNILALANPSLTEFVSDIKHLASLSIGHPHGGFGLNDLGAGVLLINMVQSLLQQFIRSKSNILPIKDNGFAWFLCHQIAKEIMWHVVFHPTSTHSVQLVLANLEPGMFKNVAHPPFLTMSLLGSSSLRKRLFSRIRKE